MPDTDRHIDPTGRRCRPWMTAAQKSAAPIVMKGGTCWPSMTKADAIHLRYAEAVQPISQVGASIPLCRRRGPHRHRRRGHSVVGHHPAGQYPSRAKFLEMVLDPGYQEIAAHRTAALHTSGPQPPSSGSRTTWARPW